MGCSASTQIHPISKVPPSKPDAKKKSFMITSTTITTETGTTITTFTTPTPIEDLDAIEKKDIEISDAKPVQEEDNKLEAQQRKPRSLPPLRSTTSRNFNISKADLIGDTPKAIDNTSKEVVTVIERPIPVHALSTPTLHPNNNNNDDDATQPSKQLNKSKSSPIKMKPIEGTHSMVKFFHQDNTLEKNLLSALGSNRPAGSVSIEAKIGEGITASSASGTLSFARPKTAVLTGTVDATMTSSGAVRSSRSNTSSTLSRIQKIIEEKPDEKLASSPPLSIETSLESASTSASSTPTSSGVLLPGTPTGMSPPILGTGLEAYLLSRLSTPKHPVR